MFEEGPVAEHQGVWAIRAYNFDNIVEAFLENNSRAVIRVCGLSVLTTSTTSLKLFLRIIAEL
jgi:hypothetical protein